MGGSKLRCSFQKSKITRGAVTPSADLHTRAHCRQGPEAYSAASPAARTAQYWPSRGEAWQRKDSYSEATGNGGVRPGWFYPEPHVRLQPLTDAAGRLRPTSSACVCDAERRGIAAKRFDCQLAEKRAKGDGWTAARSIGTDDERKIYKYSLKIKSRIYYCSQCAPNASNASRLL